MLKLLREEGELPSPPLCANLLNVIGIAKLILIWPKLTEWSNLKLWRVVADKSWEKLEFLVTIYKKKLLVRVLHMPLDYHRIILYQKCWNSEPVHWGGGLPKTSSTFLKLFGRYEDILRQYELFSLVFWIFWHFLFANKLMTSLITYDASILLPSNYFT